MSLKLHVSSYTLYACLVSEKELKQAQSVLVAIAVYETFEDNGAELAWADCGEV
jgi:hypothetical protein